MCSADQQTAEINQGESAGFVLVYSLKTEAGISVTCVTFPCQVSGFSWENCGKGEDPAVMKGLDLSPDPINIPGDLTASAAGRTSVPLVSSLSVSTAHTFTLLISFVISVIAIRLNRHPTCMH